jgi:hypothetical protein
MSDAKTAVSSSGAKQAAEKLHWRSGLYQGTSLLVPKNQQNQCRASAPANFAPAQAPFFRSL